MEVKEYRSYIFNVTNAFDSVAKSHYSSVLKRIEMETGMTQIWTPSGLSSESSDPALKATDYTHLWVAGKIVLVMTNPQTPRANALKYPKKTVLIVFVKNLFSTLCNICCWVTEPPTPEGEYISGKWKSYFFSKKGRILT